ncbi:hypothetical protein lpari_01882 [Legionella parisiensis]|uniref:Uncharacterized protein n=1 Tax=Legionella parisiensis TaxID=45071 RepID=A0A1E5JRF6_9GAMM|nr:hypothetical protein lpari_01882 [Legionella parisiensis]STX71583.1 Uncharacterised protein [Legionella parisiensis]
MKLYGGKTSMNLTPEIDSVSAQSNYKVKACSLLSNRCFR